MEPNVELGLLLGYYGGLLTPRRRKLTALYAWEDLSLQEIAEREGVSRQGVRDALARARLQMLSFERELGLIARDRALREAFASLEGEIQALPREQHPALFEKLTAMKRLFEEISNV